MNTWTIIRAGGAAVMAVAGIIQTSAQVFGPEKAGFVVLGCAAISGGILAFETALNAKSSGE